MERLFNYQEDLFSRLKKARVNFRKSPKERITKDYVESRLETLEQMWSEFRIGHKELLQKVEPTVLKTTNYISEDIYDQAEELFTDYKCELKGTLSKFKNESTSQSHVYNQNDSVAKPSQVKLPKICIPSFSGKYTEWTSFRDLFVSMIHNNEALENVQKLHYLKGYLTGEAEQLIRYIPVADANYTRCWKLLEERYNNKKYLSHCILKRLLSQKNLLSESANGIKELLDTSSDCLSALENLGIDVSTWDIIVIHLLSLKLDPETRKQWELSVTLNVTSDELPSFDSFKEFLTSRYRALEFIEPKQHRPVSQHNTKINFTHPKTLHVAETHKFCCEFCGEEHKLCFCKKFARLDYDKKHEFVSSNKMCFNCLGKNHSVRYCQKATNCQVCRKRHHSLLHPKSNSANVNACNLVQTVAAVSRDSSSVNVETNTSTENSVVNHMACCSKVKPGKQVLLATALVNVEAKSGNQHTFRALLDQGSQASFVTEATVQGLGLRKISVNGRISGLGGDKAEMVSRYMVFLKIRSRLEPDFKIEIKAYVLNNITSYLPGKKVIMPDWIKSKQLYLADPYYNTPNKIDILLGAEVYCRILKAGMFRDPAGSSVAQATTLGWILSGQVDSDQNENVTVLHTTIGEDEILKRFWELETEPKCTSKKVLSDEEEKCEKIYAATTKRNSDGKYVVKLPFREENTTYKIADSREIAIKRFISLERKFSNNVLLKERYKDVINEYLELGHMELVQEPDARRNMSVYLPHHAVIREDKTTTKVRVVFDASCKGSNGVSLNDLLMVGPTLQPELRHLIMCWRKYPVCLIADIVKMYRMVRVTNDDTDYQRIVWRDHKNESFKDYRLLTLTFGTASAPYLAVKTLNQVALDYSEQYPIAANRVLKEFYMDDLMTGCETLEEGIVLYNQMTGLLKEAGFILQKWSSNKEELLGEILKLNNIKKEEDKKMELKGDNIVKILGLTWNRTNDEFQYSVKLPPISTTITKRKIISDVARLFDPLGWIAPCVILAKIFIQRLWISGVSWDEEAPADIRDDWLVYRENLHHLTEFRIPRWIHTKSDNLSVELHGFCDASNVAYGAAVYLRVISARGEVQTCLVGSKTKVAPVKQVSIPRLELCGANLLTKLLMEITEVLSIPKSQIKAWTDSTVVLAWLNKHPCTWKTFVANRVSEILTNLDSSHWFHVSTKDNPADYASRGTLPRDLINNTLWKYGPNFLRAPFIEYTKPKNINTQEETSIKTYVAVLEEPIIERFSSLKRLLRVIAYCRRFITRNRLVGTKQTKHLNKWEIDEASMVCLKIVQNIFFSKDISDLKRFGQIKDNTSKILSLTPFLDNKGLLRVGGRLSQSHEVENIKHPILLPYNSHFSKLIIADAHEKTYHGGIQLMLNFIRSAYWIIGAKNLVKQHIRNCVKCIRYKAGQSNQLMGSLPSVRVTPARAFSRSGVDYAGPISLRTSKGRGHHAYKGYICLFVCMATKALHIDVVSDLSSRSFLETFKRFVARRGHCYELYSDNGTNFVGASKELKDLFNLEKSSMVQEVAEILATQGTVWHFIPPRAPNFGGIWEAGIKSTKYHIKRVIGDSTLTYEEMATLLSQIEACLNSRPISVLPSEAGELNPLTPGHFLIGEPLVTIPENNYESSNISMLKRWQLTQRMFQNFWRRWSNEYLLQCLHRYKWSYKIPEPQIGDIVLVKEDDLPPAKWLFGKIEQKHPGSDNITRVVTIKCNKGIIKRPTSKLCFLPVFKESDS